MSLYCDLYANGERVGTVHAHRATGDGVGADDFNAYDCIVAGHLGAPVWKGRIWHRYGDGAWGLIERVLRGARYPSVEIPAKDVPGRVPLEACDGA